MASQGIADFGGCSDGIKNNQSQGTADFGGCSDGIKNNQSQGTADFGGCSDGIQNNQSQGTADFGGCSGDIQSKQVNTLETVKNIIISPVCTTSGVKELGMQRGVHREANSNQMQLSIYVNPKHPAEEMIHVDGLTDEVGGLMRDIKSNHEADGPLTDAARIEVNTLETIKNIIISPVPTTSEAKELGMQRGVHREADPNQMQLSIYVDPKHPDEEMIHDDGLTNEVGGLMRDIKSNHEADGLLTDAARIESGKQLIEPSWGPIIDPKENDLDFAEEAIGQLDRDAEVLRNVIRYSRSTRETMTQLQHKNKELKEIFSHKEAKVVANRKKWNEKIKNLKNDLLSMTSSDRLKMLHKWREECEPNAVSKADEE